MSWGYLIGLVIGVVIGYAISVSVTAWGLGIAKESKKIVFLDQDEVKDYLFILGLKREELKAVILYKDSRVILSNLSKGPLDFLKSLDLKKHR